jgi:NADH:ubiquinone oxidoreductase subunit H
MEQVSAAFTVVQLVCLAGMWGLKNSQIGILFPLLIAALAPIRFMIEKFGWFSKEHLDILDAEDEE